MLTGVILFLVVLIVSEIDEKRIRFQFGVLDLIIQIEDQFIQFVFCCQKQRVIFQDFRVFSEFDLAEIGRLRATVVQFEAFDDEVFGEALIGFEIGRTDGHIHFRFTADGFTKLVQGDDTGIVCRQQIGDVGIDFQLKGEVGGDESHKKCHADHTVRMTHIPQNERSQIMKKLMHRESGCGLQNNAVVIGF